MRIRNKASKLPAFPFAIVYRIGRPNKYGRAAVWYKCRVGSYGRSQVRLDFDLAPVDQYKVGETVRVRSVGNRNIILENVDMEIVND